MPTILTDRNHSADVHPHSTTHDDSQELFWPIVMGIFVALALGWMICRSKCSSKERSPHIVQCCPKIFRKNLQHCCFWLFRLKKPLSKSPLSTQQITHRSQEKRICDFSIIRSKSLNTDLSIRRYSCHWSSMSQSISMNCEPSFRKSTSLQSMETISQSRQHPLRRDSNGSGVNLFSDRRQSAAQWPFRSITVDFHQSNCDFRTSGHLFLDH